MIIGVGQHFYKVYNSKDFLCKNVSFVFEVIVIPILNFRTYIPSYNIYGIYFNIIKKYIFKIENEKKIINRNILNRINHFIYNTMKKKNVFINLYIFFKPCSIHANTYNISYIFFYYIYILV